VGRPNVGKSSLFNALVGHDRAIVTAAPGTTRDLVTETINIEGLALRLVDTAGFRDAVVDDAEREGVSRSVRARGVADLLIVVLDHSEPLTLEDRQLLEETSSRCRIVVANKCDRGSAFESDHALRVSAATSAGIVDLRVALARALTGDEALRDDATISNVRHTALVEQALSHLVHAHESLTTASAPEEFVLADLHAARSSLDEVMGARANDEVLRHIFERFCIGK